MAAGWAAAETALTQLTQSGGDLIGTAWNIVQKSAADHVVTLDFNQECHIEFSYVPDSSSPTNHCIAACIASADGGTTYEEAEMAAHRVTLPFADSTGDAYNPCVKTIVVTGIHKFKIAARVFDPDGTDGSGDTGMTLDVDYAIVTRNSDS